MKSVISGALWSVVMLATLYPPVWGQTRTQPGSVAGAKYRVGLMFASSGVGTGGAGLQVQGIAPGSAAERAGLKAGDVITHVNGKPSAGDPGEFVHLFGAPEPIEFRVLRGDETLNVTVTPASVGGVAPSVGTRDSATAGQSRPGRISMGMEFKKPSVRAKINGKGPWTFLVDTGAGITIINGELAEILALPSTAKQRIGDPTDPEAINANTHRLDSISLGEATFRDVAVVSWDRSDLYSGADERPQGVLGLGLFKDYLVTFDYPAGQIAIEEGELPPVDNDEILAYTDEYGGIPEIKITLAGKTRRAHFDTGSPAPLSVPNSWEQQLTLRGPTRVVGRARTVNSEFEIRAGQLEGDLKIGGHVINDPQIVFAGVMDSIGSANIGSGLLSQFALTFDQKNRRLRMLRS